jgi:hypothetical protein
MESASWFVRSMKDHDTHRAPNLVLPGGEVLARCGARFTPKLLGAAGNRISFPADPPDPDQVCPKCRSMP